MKWATQKYVRKMHRRRISPKKKKKKNILFHSQFSEGALLHTAHTQTSRSTHKLTHTNYYLPKKKCEYLCTIREVIM